MKQKKVNQDPFSNGSEHQMFECRCCDNCIKNSWWDEKHQKFVNADDKNQPPQILTMRSGEMTMSVLFNKSH